jgi:hypothetical protein
MTTNTPAARPVDTCAGACAVHLTSYRTGGTYSAGRTTLACPSAWENRPHGEHDWYSARSGRHVHCYGA